MNHCACAFGVALYGICTSKSLPALTVIYWIPCKSRNDGLSKERKEQMIEFKKNSDYIPG
jgi:hypothetical protein